MKVNLDLTPEQAQIVRRVFLPANPNKLRPTNVWSEEAEAYVEVKFDGLTLKELAHKVIAALDETAGGQ